MYKLIFLTVLAMVTVLVVFGEGDGRRIEAAAAETGEGASENPAVPSRPVDNSIVTDVVQTPENTPRFAGPALRPSPEHASAAPAEDLSGSQGQTLYVTASSVNFRARPSTSDEVVGRLSRGQTVTALAEPGSGWVAIRDTQGRDGFISTKFLSTSRP
ncbi:MAG: SH3 domain-containing protein [Paracoccus sp. (in: a-proteobacteria)]